MLSKSAPQFVFQYEKNRSTTEIGYWQKQNTVLASQEYIYFLNNLYFLTLWSRLRLEIFFYFSVYTVHFRNICDKPTNALFGQMLLV